MSRDQTDHENDHEGDGLTIAAAALHLGISENAVRQRIKRESIVADKIDGVWRIWFPDAPDHEAILPRPSGDKAPDHETEDQFDQEDIGRDKLSNHEATSPAVAVETIPALIAQFESIRDQWLRPFVEDLNAKSERIGQLQERLTTTEQRLAAAEQERDDLRRLVEDALLADPSDEPENAPQSPQTHKTAPSDTEAETLSNENESNEAPSNERRGGIAGLWDRLRGK